ncbi:HET-domain-containing protein [Zopfia rhizophila CBS 207.26]|uniref:HET-domain-containing protein n=1 Tax=Zopfia rhizophila CBS 207.26 TaxID=1314779 RepID=A0A6A6ELM1_9PEZI|nr:HET-domain-containing protein [Zopfia rhizophila CBS 207.26]
MRLLHSQTLSLYEPPYSEIPPYAILSHTWGEDEITYQDVRGGTTRLERGYSKLQKFAHRASEDGLDYIWVDTCCIDKSSSAELSEAINSMYIWYKRAKCCYVYLEDVPFDKRHLPAAFQRSRWFTRGWTLQELIAPSTVIFYASNWHPIGSKTDPTLQDLILQTTGIDLEILSGGDIRNVSIAKRMSWAAKRETTRPEDKAYSLLGLFDVNMPLLYGEGEKRAFIRLQKEIMEDSDDHSLFAWKSMEKNYGMSCQGLLATSPTPFIDGGNTISCPDWNATTPYSMTNKGLHIELSLRPHDIIKDIFLATLDCKLGQQSSIRLAIYLKCLSAAGNQFCRVKPYALEEFDCKSRNPGIPRIIYVRQRVLHPEGQHTGGSRKIRILDMLGIFRLIDVSPQGCWNDSTRTLNLRDVDGEGTVLYQNPNMTLRFAIVVTFTRAGFCLCKILNGPRMSANEQSDWFSSFEDKSGQLNIGATRYGQKYRIKASINKEKGKGMEGFVLDVTTHILMDITS